MIENTVRKYKFAVHPVVLGSDVKLGVDEAKWVDFGVIIENDNGEFLANNENVEMGTEEILSLLSVGVPASAGEDLIQGSNNHGHGQNISRSGHDVDLGLEPSIDVVIHAFR